LRLVSISQFLNDCYEIASAAFSGKRIPKSRVKKLENYRLFFESIQSDPILSRLADYSLKLLDENIEFVAIYNELGDSEELREKARHIYELMKEREKIMDEIERKVGLNGV
jgi:hypothetical protein